MSGIGSSLRFYTNFTSPMAKGQQEKTKKVAFWGTMKTGMNSLAGKQNMVVTFLSAHWARRRRPWRAPFYIMSVTRPLRLSCLCTSVCGRKEVSRCRVTHIMQTPAPYHPSRARPRVPLKGSFLTAKQKTETHHKRCKHEYPFFYIGKIIFLNLHL